MTIKRSLLIGFFALVAIVHIVSAHEGHDHEDINLGKESSRPADKVRYLDSAPVVYPEGTDTTAAMDEAMSGRTLLGTPVRMRGVDDFPAEYRDVFWQMDSVPSGENGLLEPLNFDRDGDGKIGYDGVVGKAEIDAIRGRNTWLLWGGGNEVFWGWLQERGYGLVDFLVLMDGRGREDRFHRTGLINQPGFAANKDKNPSLLGLYLDKPDRDNIKLTVPAIDPATGKAKLNEAGTKINSYYDKDRKPLFEEGKDRNAEEMLEAVKNWFAEADDGLNPDVYGYPSGILGLRLMLNPDFFGATKAAAEARSLWKSKVMSPTHSSYYNDSKTNANPNLVRPFRVSMSCAFCHVGPHPLNPPEDPEKPEWKNLSSFIGGQYWRPQAAFGNLLQQNSFLYHFLASQAPGTIDTSLVSTDHINNTNTINGVFEVPARFVRANSNTPEKQGEANLLIPRIGIEKVRASGALHFPRVLIDGSDSCGGFAAFIRVPLNIGTYSEEWANCHNPIIGYRPQSPFRVSSSQKNSVYWQINQKYRVPYLASFFTYDVGAREYKSSKEVKLSAQNSTRAMKLFYAGPDENSPTDNLKRLGQAALESADDAQRLQGRKLFLQNCAICHSSKQPDGFQLTFSRDVKWSDWSEAPAPVAGKKGAVVVPHYTLPMDFSQWGSFKKSAAYQDYVGRITELAKKHLTDEDMANGIPLGKDDPFILDNFLSSEIRIPVTLVGTNAGRATATNAMRGHVWDNFSSEDYKLLPAVGEVHYYNPFLNKIPDAYGNNATYQPPGGGPGYYRPATLASLWSTAPFIHNNTMGGYYPHRVDDKEINPTSVRGRLDAFDDAIRKVLWTKKRATPALNAEVRFERASGDLRQTDVWATRDKMGNEDPGYIYRLPKETYIGFEAPFIRQLIAGVTGPTVLFILQWGVWLALLALWVFAYFKGGTRHVGILFLGLGLLVVAACLLTGAGSVMGTTMGALFGAATGMLRLPTWILWTTAAVFLGAGIAFLFGARLSWIGPVAVASLGLVIVAVLVFGLARIIGVDLPLVPASLNRIPVWFLWVLVGVCAVLALVIYLTQRHYEWATRTVFASLAAVAIVGCVATNGFLAGCFGGISVGPIPKGVPVNLMMNLDPEKGPKLARGVVAMVQASLHIKKNGLRDEAAYRHFADHAGAALLDACTCPDFVLDRGHWFGEYLTDYEKDKDAKPVNEQEMDRRKEALISFLKTL